MTLFGLAECVLVPCPGHGEQHRAALSSRAECTSSLRVEEHQACCVELYGAPPSTRLALPQHQSLEWRLPALSPQDYTVRGLLGKATDNFCEDGRLVEKTTYGESQGGAGEVAASASLYFLSA